MLVLVTGASGYLGRAVVGCLAAAESAIGWACEPGRISATTLRLFNLAGATGERGDPDPTRILPRAIAAATGTLSQVDINGTGATIRIRAELTWTPAHTTPDPLMLSQWQSQKNDP